MYIYGRNVCKKKVLDNDKVNHAYLKENFNDREILELLKKSNIRYTFLQNKIMDKKVDGNHQGIILDVDDIKTYDLDYVINLKKNNPLIVILDHIEDPHNFGAIIRTCECAGVDYIIIPRNRSVSVNSTVYKTSCGALANVKIIEVVNLTNTITKLKDLGFWVYGAEANGKNYSNIKFDTKTCLVIGSEGHGLKQIVTKNCDEIISLPMKGKINSLNASVACGILIYEIMKYK